VYSFILGDSRLAMGLQGGILSLNSDWTLIRQTPSIDPTIDPTFGQETVSGILPNFGVGLYYYQPNKFYIGAAAPHLIENKLGASKVAHQYRHYNIMGGLVFGGDKVKLKPSALVKLVPKNAPVQLDANMMVFFMEGLLGLGVSYRTALGNTSGFIASESIDGILALQLKNGLRIGYAYDFTLSDLQTYTSGSHEIMLGYDIIKEGPRIRTPRYL